MIAKQPKLPTPDRPDTTAQSQPRFFARASTARILPFATYMSFIAIADLLTRLGYTAQELLWLYPVKIAAVAAVLLVYRHHYTELAWRTMQGRQILAALLAGIVVLILWVSLSAPWMQIGVSPGFNPTDANGAVNWWLVGLRVAGAALVVPVMEELFWRSFLMRWLEHHNFLDVYPASVGLRAFAINVALFGIEHNLWLAGMVAGVAYSLLYKRTGNLWSAILAHAATNGLLGVWVVMTASWTYW